MDDVRSATLCDVTAPSCIIVALIRGSPAQLSSVLLELIRPFASYITVGFCTCRDTVRGQADEINQDIIATCTILFFYVVGKCVDFEFLYHLLKMCKTNSVT